VRVLGQFGDGGHGDFAAGAAGDVVEHDRQAEVGHGRKVLDQAGLGGLVVVGGDLQGAVHAHGLRLGGQFEGFGGGIGPGAGDDLHAPGGGFHDDADHLEVLVHVEGGGFAGGAHGHEAVDAARDLEFDQLAEPTVVDRAVAAEGGDECGICAWKHGFCLLLGLKPPFLGESAQMNSKKCRTENGCGGGRGWAMFTRTCPRNNPRRRCASTSRRRCWNSSSRRRRRAACGSRGGTRRRIPAARG